MGQATIIYETVRRCSLPVTSELARYALSGKDELPTHLSQDTATGWPSSDTMDVLTAYLEVITADPSLTGWGPWLIVLSSENRG